MSTQEKTAEEVPGAIRQHDLTSEVYREYEWFTDATGVKRIYRIDNPKTLYLRNGGTTHRVEDSSGVVHCVPTVGYMGCVLRWVNKDGKPSVQF